MSHSPQNAGFFDTIQMYFLEATGRGVMFSGRDMELLTRWREQGASAATICRGIDEALKNMDDEPPRGLYVCERWIDEAIEQASELAAGAHEAPPSSRSATSAGATERARSARGSSPARESAGEVSAKRSPSRRRGEPNDPSDDACPNPYAPLFQEALDNVEEAGRACDDDARRQVYRQAWRDLKALMDADDVDDPFSELAAIEDALIEGFFRALDQAEQERIEEAITSQNRADLAIMSPEARREHLAARRRRLMMREYGLSPLID